VNSIVRTREFKSVPKVSREKTASKKKLRTVSLIYVPLHLGGPHRGVSMGPAAMKVAETAEKIERLGLRVVEEIDIDVPRSVCWGDQSTAKCIPEILKVSQDVSDAVDDALANGHIPVTIGGDHSLAIGSIAGVSKHFRRIKKDFGLVWFDAHGDINTPDTSESGNVHGMPLAISLGRGDSRLVDLNDYQPKVPRNRTALIGIRSLDEPERELIDDFGVAAFTMKDIDHLGLAEVMSRALGAIGGDISGLHVSFDLDVIDPDVAPGVSTDSRGGLNYRESHLALELLAETDLVTSVDIVELNPALDVRNRTAELGAELILSVLGKRIL
jgi:arginase